MADHRLLLLRHAQAVESASGVRDHERPLTDYGIEQATAVGGALRSRGLKIDRALCSSATRTRQTWNALGLNADVDYTDDLYNAGSDSILELIRMLDDQIGMVMVIGHGPGLPTLAAQLAGPGSDQRSLEMINNRYPVATVSEFEVDEPWSALATAKLVWLRLGR